MTAKIVRTLTLSLCLAGLPIGVSAQEPAPAQPAELETDSAATARIQGWVIEMQELNGVLQQLQQQALEDPELNAQQEALGERIRAAMNTADPTLETSMAAVDQLQLDAAAAEQRGDTARLEEIGEEVRRIEAQFLDAQQRVLTSPEISADLEAFYARVEAKIAELNPQAPQMIARFVELRERLASALQRGG